MRTDCWATPNGVVDMNAESNKIKKEYMLQQQQINYNVIGCWYLCPLLLYDSTRIPDLYGC